MNVTSARKKLRRRRRLRLGDMVEYYVGPQRWVAKVVEDRGNLGVGGRRILRITTVSRSPGAQHTVEMPEEMLKLVRRRTGANGRS